MSEPQRIVQNSRFRDFELYPFQVKAIEAIDADRSVLVSAPTGAGKTLIAEYAIERALEFNRRIVYTSPIKALSNQKYRDFVSRYGDKIGIMTGDVTINGDAPVQIMTTEIFRNTLFENMERCKDISYVIMDEIHYIADSDRGTVWEESLIFAPEQVRFLGLSATISNLEEFRAWVSNVRSEPVDLVATEDRPVPLKHQLFVPELGVLRISELKSALPKVRAERRSRRKKAPFNILDHLTHEDLLPALCFCFSRRECETRAKAARRRPSFIGGADRERLLSEFDSLCERYQVKKESASELRKLAEWGVLYHHAGMLPTFKEIVERLFTTGLVKLLITTETFALGVNMPARSVVFTSLRKFDGVGFDYIPTLNYFQMAGRAGRQGLDTEGHVFSMVDIEKDTQKDVKNVIFGRVSPLISQFNLSYSAVLNLYALLGKDIFSAADRSFAAWQRGGSSAKDRALLRSRLQVLERHGYIQGAELTGKGRLACKINGYEISVTELFWDGCFEGLNPAECAMLIGAIVYEPRRSDFHQSFVSGLGNTLRNKANKRIAEFRRSERAFGLNESVRELDFSLGGAIKAWVEGCEFEELSRFTSSQDGDLVRQFRMTVQVLRQFAHAISSDTEARDRLQAALSLINRDEVDAERQLRLG